MSCFWDTLGQAIMHPDLADMRKKYNIKDNRDLHAKAVAKFFKQHNIPTPNVTWQNTELTMKEMKENYERIHSYNIKEVSNGYLCSTCEPFILLFAELFEASIEHNYVNVIIKYENTKNSRCLLKFGSNKSHIYYA